MSTAELHPVVQSLHPDLCDDRVDRVINDGRFGKRWKHVVRAAVEMPRDPPPRARGPLPVYWPPAMTPPRNLLQPLLLGRLTVEPPLVLAPMAGYTNHAFRRLCRELGGCGLACSELISSRALHFRSSRSRTLDLLDWTPDEGPVAVQLFGSDPRLMAEAARVVADRGATVVDLNLGCWVPKVARQGAGAALLRDLSAARAMVEAVVGAVEVPVTVKVRLGWEAGERTAADFARLAADGGVRAVAVHARTAAQGLAGPAAWEGIAEVVQAVPGLPVIGNGDVCSGSDARRMLEQTGCVAVMIGRAALGAPWIFRLVEHELRTGVALPGPSLPERAAVALRQVRLTLRTSPLPRRQAVRGLRGALARYRFDPPGGHAVRDRLVRAETLEDLEEILEPLAGPPPEGGA